MCLVAVALDGVVCSGSRCRSLLVVSHSGSLELCPRNKFSLSPSQHFFFVAPANLSNDNQHSNLNQLIWGPPGCFRARTRCLLPLGGGGWVAASVLGKRRASSSCTCTVYLCLCVSRRGACLITFNGDSRSE